MSDQRVTKIRSIRKTIIDDNNQEVQPGSRIIQGYWGEHIVFGSKIPGETLCLKIRMTGAGSKIRLINPLMNPDNVWEEKKTSVYIDWGDGLTTRVHKKYINSGRFNRDSDVTLEHTYTTSVGEEFWLSITSVEPLIPYGCEIVEMLGTLPSDRYDLNMNGKGEYCGLFGVNQYIEDYVELNKLYNAGITVRKVSSTLLDRWKDTHNMNNMFKDWNALVEVPVGFFKDNILRSCESYFQTFADCDVLATVDKNLLGITNNVVTTTEKMFARNPLLTNMLDLTNTAKLENVNSMYANCPKLTCTDSSPFLINAPALKYAEAFFMNDVSLTVCNWTSLLMKSSLLETVQGAFKNTGITHGGLFLGDKPRLKKIDGLYQDCKKLLTVREDMFNTNTSSYYNNDTTQENKLTMSHLFENAGDPTVGLSVPDKIFYNALIKRGPGGVSILGYNQRYIFAGATLKGTDANNSYYAPNLLFNSLFMYSAACPDHRYDIAHMYDGTKFTCPYISFENSMFTNNNAVDNMSYSFANTQIDNFGHYLTVQARYYCTTFKGMFKGSTINCRINEKFFYQPDWNGWMKVEDYSEMFMDVKYKFPDYPVDYIVCTSANQVDMTNMFTGSNIDSYRPIHWRSNELATYNLKNFTDRSCSTPKEWMLDGYADKSDWEPTIAPKPFIMWVNIDSKHRTVTFSGNVSVSVDWGDGSSDPGLVDGDMTHTYTADGDYKISITSNVAHQPTLETLNRIYRLDGELPYDAEIDFDMGRGLQSIHNNRIDEFDINYVGARVCALAKKVKLNVQGYIHPNLLKYGSNTGYKEGLKYIEIVDPMKASFSFSADFVIVDKTIDMTVEFEPVTFKILDTTHVELTVGLVRNDSDTCHIDFTYCTPRNIPLRFWHNCIGHKFNKLNNIKMLDPGYMRPEHFQYRFGRTLHPESTVREYSNFTRATTELMYHPTLVQPKNILPYLRNTPVLRFHPGIRNTLVNSIDVNSVIGRAMTTRGYSDFDDACKLTGTHEDHWNEFDEEFMTFVLENVDDDISIINLHDSNGTKYGGRELGIIDVEILDPETREDDSTRYLKFDNQLGSLGHITATKIAIRVKAQFPVWLSCYDKITEVYGMITNREGDFILSQNFGRPIDVENVERPALAPNIKYVGESIFWALMNTSYSNKFGECTKLQAIPPALFAFSLAIFYENAFYNCTSLKRIPDNLIHDNGVVSASNYINVTNMFYGCSGVTYVYHPICDSIMENIALKDMLNGCKTYAFKNDAIEDVNTSIILHDSLGNYFNYKSQLAKMTLPNNVPVLDKTHLVSMGRTSSVDTTYVAVASSLSINPANLIDKWYNLDYIMWVNVPRYAFDGTTANLNFGLTSDQYNRIWHFMPQLRGYTQYENSNGLVNPTDNIAPEHFMLYGNENLLFMNLLLGGTKFNYTPNVFFCNQWKMVDATGLLLRTRFDKIPEYFTAPPTHLPNIVPVYIGGESTGTRWHPRPLDRMLCYRNNFLILQYFMNTITEGDVSCPTFSKHRLINLTNAFHNDNVMVDDTTFIDIDRDSNVYQTYLDNITLKGMFYMNTAITTDCRIFHIWREVPESHYEFEATTNFKFPPADMFDAVTRLTDLDKTFYRSNLRELPRCNPMFKKFYYFAANTQLSLIDKYWFNYNGAETMDMTYAFNNCTGLVIMEPIVDPGVTAPVIKYASLENAYSNIGDDDVIFAGVNTALDGSDRSLVNVIREEDVFKQTIRMIDPSWTLSLRGLNLDPLGTLTPESIFLVQWGDGSKPSVVSFREMEWEDYSHKYESSGEYTIQIMSPWCCYVSTTDDLETKMTTKSIDSMFQNTTIAELEAMGLTEMFGTNMEAIYEHAFDKCSDVGTAKTFQRMFMNFKKMKSVPKELLWKMVAMEDLTSFNENGVLESVDAELLSKNVNLKIAARFFYANKAIVGLPSGFFTSNINLESTKYMFADCHTVKAENIPKDLLYTNTKLKNTNAMFGSNGRVFVVDNSFDDFLSKNLELEDAARMFSGSTMKELPPNIINRNTKLTNVEGMFAGHWSNDDKVDNEDETFWWIINDNLKDGEMNIPAGFFPPSITNASRMFTYRPKLMSYPAGVFDTCTKLNNTVRMFMNTGITVAHKDTFRTQTVNIDATRMFYKDPRLGKDYHIHELPKIVSSTYSGVITTKDMLLGCYGVWTEGELFSGVNTNPQSIESLYTQEYKYATFLLRMTGDGTYITFKPITASEVLFTGLTRIDWGDGTDDEILEEMTSADIPNKIKHTYKTPGDYLIKVGAKYCLVPVLDGTPDAWQVGAVTIQGKEPQVQYTNILDRFGIRKLTINKDSIYVEKQTAEVEMEVVGAPYYVGDTYKVEIEVENESLDIGATTTVEVDIVRDVSDPFERLEIGGVLGPMEGITTLPRIYQHVELQYGKWVGGDDFFSRNTHITSLARSFMNLPYEFRIADGVFRSLGNVESAGCIFWNTKLVIEPGYAPDFNKCTKLNDLASAFRAGHTSDVGTPADDPYIPTGTPINKITWNNVNESNYQPFASLSSITNMSNICIGSDIPHVLKTNMNKMVWLANAYLNCPKLTSVPADYLRTLNSTANTTISLEYMFKNTGLSTITPAADGNPLLNWTVGAGSTYRMGEMFGITKLSASDIITMINDCPALTGTTSVGTVDMVNMFWNTPGLRNADGSKLKINIPNKSGVFNLVALFDVNGSGNTVVETGLYNIPANAITIGTGPDVAVTGMFSGCYADTSVMDARQCFNVAGDDANFTKAKELADKSALNTLTVMTTTVVPK